MNNKELKKYCSKINYIVGKNTINTEDVSNDVVTDYYTKTDLLYRKFHSKEGAMHFPISFSDKDSHHNKLLYQAEYVNSILDKYDYSNVLEIGCGKGFNSIFLAKKNHNRKFTGIDLTPDNIKFASQKATKLNNAHFIKMDYNELEIPKEKYDLIFAIETLCHSKNLIKLITSFNELLTENGRIIIFDGFEKQKVTSSKEPLEMDAYNILTWGFALKKFHNLDEILNSESIPFKFDDVTDYSENILSNVTVFQNGSKSVLRFPFLIKFLYNIKIIPLAFIKQISAGLFGTHFIKNSYLGYYKLNMSKKSSSKKM